MQNFVKIAGLAAAALLTLTAAGSAADLRRAAAPAPIAVAPPPPPVAYNWTGVYLGINGGWGWGESRFDFVDLGTTTGDFDIDGGMVGGTLGLNWQTGAWVFGVEGDLDWTNINGSAPCPNPLFTCETANNWLATVRGRLGFAAGNVLVYATGGGAFGDVEMTSIGFNPSQKDTRAGWSAGGGIELALTSKISVKAEYLHIDLGTANCTLGNCSGLTDTHVPFRVDTARLGLNWRM